MLYDGFIPFVQPPNPKLRGLGLLSNPLFQKIKQAFLREALSSFGGAWGGLSISKKSERKISRSITIRETAVIFSHMNDF